MRLTTKETNRLTSGFTIVELLVATAVTAVLIGLMISITSGVLTAWNRTSGTLGANNQAKIVLDQVAQDLQAAVLRYDPSNPGAVWFAVEILDQWPTGGGHIVPTLANQRGWVTPPDPQSLILKPTRTQNNRSYDLQAPSLADCRYGFGGAWLRLFSNSTGGQNTVPSAVSYQVVRRHITSSPTSPNPAEIRYMLYRSEVAGRDGPLRYGYDLTGTSAGPGPGIGPPNPLPNAHYGDSTAAGDLINPAAMDIIGNNVIDFGVRLYVRRPPSQPPGLDPVFPVNPATLNFSDNHTQYLADGTTTPFPDVADIMVRILTEEGARQIQHLEAGRTFRNLNNAQKLQEWWNIAEANSRVFTRRVFLNADPY